MNFGKMIKIKEESLFLNTNSNLYFLKKNLSTKKNQILKERRITKYFSKNLNHFSRVAFFDIVDLLAYAFLTLALANSLMSDLLYLPT